MIQVHVIQRLSRCLSKDDDKFVIGAMPGMLLVDGKPHQSVDVRVHTVGIQWLDCHGRKVLYIRYECLLLNERRDPFCFFIQRPFSAELTGELRKLHDYRISAESHSKLVGNEYMQFYAFKAEEINQPH